MRPVRDQTVLVTGATDGLGKALATELARAGATVIVHGRDDNRGKATLAEITEATGSDRLHWYQADLAHLDQVRDLAAAVAADSPRLDVLVSNAGIGGSADGRQESAEGIELRFAVNYLAGYLLTRLLLPTLRSFRAAVRHRNRHCSPWLASQDGRMNCTAQPASWRCARAHDLAGWPTSRISLLLPPEGCPGDGLRHNV